MGERLCYVAVDAPGRWLALLVFNVAAKHLKVALARQKRLAEAIEQFREVLRLNPSHEAARKYLETALSASRRAL